MSACILGVFERLGIARRVARCGSQIRRSQPYPIFIDHWRQVPHRWSTRRQGWEVSLICAAAQGTAVINTSATEKSILRCLKDTKSSWMVDMAYEIFRGRWCGVHGQSLSCSVAICSYVVVKKMLIMKIVRRRSFPCAGLKWCTRFLLSMKDRKVGRLMD